MKKKIAALRQARGKQIEIMEANVACASEEQKAAYNAAKAEAERLAAEADELERLMNEDANEAAVELSRRTEIGKIAQAGKLDLEFANEHIEKGTSVEEFRRVAFERLAARSAAAPTQGHRVEMSRDEADTRRVAFKQALLHRYDETRFALKDSDPGYQYRGLVRLGLVRTAEEFVRLAGRNPHHMSPAEMVQFALQSTTDFPYILGSTADASLRAGFSMVQVPWNRIAARRSASNFKSQYEISAATAASFPQVKSSGEFTHGHIDEGRESWKLYTYGQIIGITRQVILNDDLGALTTIPSQMGMKAGMKQASLVLGVLKTNGVMTDGVALFAAGHSNLINPGTAISVDNLGIARRTLKSQTDLAGDVIELSPRYLVCSDVKEQIALQYMNQAFFPATEANTNPWKGTMEVLAFAGLNAANGGSDAAWYIFADPAIAPVLIYAYLNGQEGVYSETRQGFDVDGVEWKARMDFGCGAVDVRGAVKNDGA